MTVPVMRLREMREDEFEAYSDERDLEYAEAEVATGSMSLEAARERARRGRAEFLPQGLATERHRLLVAQDAAGEVVGSVWIGFEEPRTKSPEMAWLYDLRVEPSHRRAGYGRAILAAVEELAREAGALRLGLNVFGDNRAAIALYEACGYTVMTQQMAKRL
jgi:ribosomal protein S18 acetylase RimI-like enzyme